ncbi:MAG: GcrA family cell cycle regulator, partial [Bradyrhizobium sp.]
MAEHSAPAGLIANGAAHRRRAQFAARGGIPRRIECIDISVANQVSVRQRSPWEWMMWTDRLDAKLLKLKRDGLSFAEIGERIGVTRNAALGRFQRLNGIVFPSQAARRQARKETARLKEEARLR